MPIYRVFHENEKKNMSVSQNEKNLDYLHKEGGKIVFSQLTQFEKSNEVL